MPPRGVKKGTKRARQYEHIKKSQRRRGTSVARAEEIAARTGQRDIVSSRRGGLRSGTKTQLERAVDAKKR